MRYNNKPRINDTLQCNRTALRQTLRSLSSISLVEPQLRQEQAAPNGCSSERALKNTNTNTCTPVIGDLLISMYNFNMIGLFGEWNGVCGTAIYTDGSGAWSGRVALVRLYGNSSSYHRGIRSSRQGNKKHTNTTAHTDA